jgi:hypothetical protein
MKQRKLAFSSLELRFPRRAQGLPLNTIIIAVLGLLVLVIIFMLVQSQVTKTGKGLKNVTESKCDTPNTVVPIGECDNPIYGSFSNVKLGQEVCCKPPTP